MLCEACWVEATIAPGWPNKAFYIYWIMHRSIRGSCLEISTSCILVSLHLNSRAAKYQGNLKFELFALDAPGNLVQRFIPTLITSSQPSPLGILCIALGPLGSWLCVVHRKKRISGWLNVCIQMEQRMIHNTRVRVVYLQFRNMFAMLLPLFFLSPTWHR